MSDISFVAILIGIGVNLVAVMALIWRFGSWSGRVTTLLEAHQSDLVGHDKTLSRLDREVAEMRGAQGLAEPPA